MAPDELEWKPDWSSQQSPDAWMQELRDRTHDLARVVQLMIAAEARLGRRLEQTEEAVRRMATAEAVTEGVSLELARRDKRHNEQQARRWKRWGFLVGLPVVTLEVVNFFLQHTP